MSRRTRHRSSHSTQSADPPKPIPPDNGLPAGPAEPPKDPGPDMGLPPGPTEPPKIEPPHDLGNQQIAATSVTNAEVPWAGLSAPQAPRSGHLSAAGATGTVEALFREALQMSAPQAPGPTSGGPFTIESILAS